MPAEKMTLPVGGKLRKSGSAKNLSGSTKPVVKSAIKPVGNPVINQPTIKQPIPNSNRSQMSNTPSLRKGRLMSLDGRLLSSTDSKEMNSRLEEMIEQNKHLDHKLTSNTHAFKDVLIYCQKTIENQDSQIERLDEAFKKLNETYEEKLRNERKLFQDEMQEANLTIDRLNTENLLMKTQLSNLEQLELELKGAQQNMEKIQKELAEKNKQIGERELKQRELVIITTEKVRKELEIEFAKEVEKIKKELQIQNRAVLEANQHVVLKVKLQMKKVEEDLEYQKSEVRRLIEELEAKAASYLEVEKEKKRLDMLIKKVNDQADQKLYEMHQHLEKMELKARQDTEEHEKEISRLARELEDLNERYNAQEKLFQTCQLNLCSESDTRRVISEKLQNQNQKLLALRDFLRTVFETNNDNYIDLVLGENRAAVFSKLSTLIQTIPVLSEEPKQEPIKPQLF